TLDWSYDLLDPDAQRLLAQLGVFAGGCTLTSAESVCRVGDSVLEGLATLVDESLVSQRQSEEPRFTLLQVVRDYALERLSVSGENDEIGRHTSELQSPDHLVCRLLLQTQNYTVHYAHHC